ncbi:hypothetical protein V8F06_012102 [Rhypophila decipiens]
MTPDANSLQDLPRRASFSDAEGSSSLDGTRARDVTHSDEGDYNNSFRGSSDTHDWKPAFSGPLFRRLLWLSIWCTMLLYYTISVLVLNHPQSLSYERLGRWAPPAMSSFLAVFTAWVVAAEIRRENYQVATAPERQRKHRSKLQRVGRVVFYLLAPVLSIPLWPMRYTSSVSAVTWLRPVIPLVTFPSWKESAKFFAVANIPEPAGSNLYQDFELELKPPGKDRDPIQVPRWDTWRLTGNWSDVIDMKEDHLKPWRILELDTDSLGVSLLGWSDALHGDVGMMPIYPV